MSKLKPWFRGEFSPSYALDEPRYYDPENFDWVPKIEAQWEVIRDELLSVIQSDETALEPYKDLSMTDKQDAWKTAGLMYWTFESDSYIGQFPKTWAILKDIPQLTSCSLLALEPESSVKPHHGDTNAMVRCHMGLVVPAALPKCGLRVGNKAMGWEHGKIFMFNDAHLHTAWNNSEQVRYILSFDVMRPEFEQYRTWVSVRVLGQIYKEILYQNHPWLSKWMKSKPADRLMLGVSRTVFRYLKAFRLPLYDLL